MTETAPLPVGEVHATAIRVGEAAAKLRFAHYEVAAHADGSPVESGRGGMGVTYRAVDTRRALEGQERVLGPEHSDTLMTLSNLAQLLDTKGDPAAAEPVYRWAQASVERLLLP